MKLGLLLLLLGQNVEAPVWWKALNPEAQIRLRWNERFEDGYDQSGPQFRLRAGLFPKFEEQLTVGVELSSFVGSSDSVSLSGGMGSKQIGFSQVYLGFEAQSPLIIRLKGGKWANPIPTSALVYNDDLRPEGFFESLSFDVGSRLRMSLYGAQMSLDQVDASRFLGERQQRVWGFLQGMETQWNWDEDTFVQLALNSTFFLDMSSQIADLSARRGNSFLGTLGTNASLPESYAPLEAYLKMEGKPLGLSAGASAAFAINPRSNDKHHGFLAEAHIGNRWRKRSFFLRLMYFYIEPDLSVAAFAEDSVGFMNRKGPRAEIDYFFVEQLRLGLSYVYADTVSSSPLQSARHEIQGDVEVRF